MDIILSKLIPIRISLFKVMIKGVHTEISFPQIFNYEKYTMVYESWSILYDICSELVVHIQAICFFENHVGKRRIRHTATQKLNDKFLNRLKIE